MTSAHLMKMGIVFAVGLCLCLVIVGLVYTRLITAKRVFDEDELIDVGIAVD
jgi:uncharacterized membrane protein YciS (DUF1049 family)